ncbi:MAG: polysaccharide biosynthesis protein [Caloramator sp.]|nr:polysaccharide biosynthesis protein [Caloramator sp.]
MNRQIKQIFLVILDVLFINASIFIGYFVRFSWKIPNPYLTIYYRSFIPISIIMIICFSAFKLYKSVWRYASIDELISVILAVSLGTVLSFIFGQIAKPFIGNRLPISIYLIMWALTILMSGGIRFLRRIMASIEMVPSEVLKKSKRTLIIGAGDAGAIVVKEMKKHPELGFIPVAFVDDDESKKGQIIHGVPIVGSRDDIEDIVISKDIDEILIALPSASLEERQKIFKICSNTGCHLKTLPGIYELIDGKVSVNQIRDVEIEDLLGREPVELNIDEIAGYLENKIVLVTGGGGSIGSELCRQIARFSPRKLLILDIYENGAYDLQMELNRKYPNIDKEVIIASIREKNRLEEIFSKYKIDVVFHAAAHKHVPLMESNPKEAIKNNVIGTLNLVECADKYNVKKFVQISTDKAVNPTNIMGATKRMCEMIIQAIDKISNTEFVAVRFGNVLGSSGSVIPLFKKQIREGGPVTVTHPEINRYFMTIPEAAQLVIQAGAMAKGGEIFILDMGKPVKILDLAKDLIRLSGLEPDKDIKIEFTGLRPGEKLYEELLMDEEGIQNTKHKKIFIGKPGNYDFRELRKNIMELYNKLNCKDEEVFDRVEQLVPTYHRKKN